MFNIQTKAFDMKVFLDVLRGFKYLLTERISVIVKEGLVQSNKLLGASKNLSVESHKREVEFNCVSIN